MKASKHRIRLRDGRELQYHSPGLGPDGSALSLSDFVPQGLRSIEVEIGPGKGEFLAARAQRFPERFFVGIDRRSDRSRLTENKLKKNDQSNWIVIREDARRFLENALPPLKMLHVYQPDPWPKARHHKHRFFRSPDAYRWAQALEKGGELRVSTDHKEYFLEILDIVESWEFLSPTFVARKNKHMGAPMTHFEALFLNKDQEVFKAGWLR
jgi:tRNA (guanine-N(7)-)-methyltransferase